MAATLAPEGQAGARVPGQHGRHEHGVALSCTLSGEAVTSGHNCQGLWTHFLGAVSRYFLVITRHDLFNKDLLIRLNPTYV